MTRGNGLLTIITRMLKLGRRRRFGRSPLASKHNSRQGKQSMMSPEGNREGDSDNVMEFASPAVSLSADLGGSFDSFKTAKSSASLVDVASLGTPRKLSEDVDADVDVERERLKGMNPLEWLASDAPDDVLPRILSFAGPRKLYALSCASKAWRKLTMKDAVWKTMCEDLQKWSPNEPIPQSWIGLYRSSPCVPIDYDTIESAFNVTRWTDNDSPDGTLRGCNHQRNTRILLRPDKYVINEQLVVEAVGSNRVTLESVDGHAVRYDDFISSGRRKAEPFEELTPSKRSRWMGILGCRSSHGATDTTPLRDESPQRSNFDMSSLSIKATPQPDRAEIVLQTQKANEPIIRVKQGTFCLNKVNLVHNCTGNDIWNGNAAVQVQPLLTSNGSPVLPPHPNMAPNAIVSNCDIKSVSGRGVVAIDGGKTHISNCYIHDCAATGIYVGGSGSSAFVEQTDVLLNGNGNETARRGIARGHSGIYLEQGSAVLRDCNISSNSLTGISAVSSDNCSLVVENSDLVGNGSMQLEMPPHGTASRARCVSRNNVVMSNGQGRSRSGLIPEDLDEDDEYEIKGDMPQSPIGDNLPEVAFAAFAD
eukprot:CAMPEP_0116018508 /NCGR_PEP_ID=MMETSP0321-20121206/8688_1 /TAXON_ID=163516 /ORGANISM="Leptocylindrus danicus var. danicus, Strain B650" /LENGTH=591 /DNA_ID=CAMNT_0003488911 /DNA_START=178 /DNA_END=1953 /DNA_ORIENTATION=+